MGEIKNNPVPQADPSSEIEGLVEQIAGIIIGPRNDVPASSKFTLAELRRVRWDAASRQDKAGATWEARTIVDQVIAPLLSRLSPTPIDQIQAAREGQDWRNRGLTNAERLILFAAYHAEKLGPALAGELEELAHEWMEEVGSLQSTPSPQGGTVGRDPEGWVLVPREPTQEMLEQGLNSLRKTIRNWDQHGRVLGAYRYMIEAAPRPSHEGMSDAGC